MTETKKILLIGRTGRGKSTLANVLLNKNGNFEEIFKEGAGSISETKDIQSEELDLGQENLEKLLDKLSQEIEKEEEIENQVNIGTLSEKEIKTKEVSATLLNKLRCIFSKLKEKITAKATSQKLEKFINEIIEEINSEKKLSVTIDDLTLNIKKILKENFQSKEKARYCIVDTPGIGDTKLPTEKILDIIAEAVYLAKDGINRIFFVINDRFDQYEMATYDLLRTIIFDEHITKHTTVVRTHFEEFREKTKCKNDIDSMAKEGSKLAEIIKSCQKRIIHVDNPSISIAASDDKSDDEDEEELINSRKTRSESREKILNHLEKSCQSIYKPPKLEKLSKEIIGYMEGKISLKKDLKRLVTNDQIFWFGNDKEEIGKNLLENSKVKAVLKKKLIKIGKKKLESFSVESSKTKLAITGKEKNMKLGNDAVSIENKKVISKLNQTATVASTENSSMSTSQTHNKIETKNTMGDWLKSVSAIMEKEEADILGISSAEEVSISKAEAITRIESCQKVNDITNTDLLNCMKDNSILDHQTEIVDWKFYFNGDTNVDTQDKVKAREKVLTDFIIKKKITQLENKKEKLKKEIQEKEEIIRQKVLKHIFNNYDVINEVFGGETFIDKLSGNNNWTDINKEFVDQDLVKEWLSRGFYYQQVKMWAWALGRSFDPTCSPFYAWIRDNKGLIITEELSHDIEKLKEEYVSRLGKEVDIFDSYSKELSQKEGNLINAQSWLERQKECDNKEKRNKIKKLDISDKNLEGCLNLQDFSSLEWLDCSYNKLTDLDVSKCLNLKEFSCYRNKLMSLSLDGMENLEWLDCSSNQLTSLNTSRCLSLTELWCYENQLVRLSLSVPSNLEKLVCYNNLLTGLDFSTLNGEKITYLSLEDNNFSERDLSCLTKFIKLKELYLGTNCQIRFKQGVYNRWVGSLEYLKDLTQLWSLDIGNTDISKGTEWLPSSIICINCSTIIRPSSKVKQIKKELSDLIVKKWQTIHPNFTEKLWKLWEERLFSYEECKKWIDIGLKVSDADYAEWLRRVKKVDSEWVLNHGNEKDLRVEYQTWYQPQIQIPPK